MSAADGAFSSASEGLTVTLDTSGWSANTTVYVDAKDGAGNWGPATAASAILTVTAKDTFTVVASAAGLGGNAVQGSTDTPPSC